MKTVWWALGALLVVGPASGAEPGAAEVLFDRGVTAMKRQDYEAACPRIEESHRMEPRAGTLFTLAECHRLAGRSATAMARYREYLRVFGRMSPREQQAQRGRDDAARTQLVRLETDVPHLRLLPPSTLPVGLVVERDGVALGEPSFGSWLPVDPGPHTISIDAPQYMPQRLDFVIGPGEHRELQLPNLEAEAVEPSLPVPAPIPKPVTPPVVEANAASAEAPPSAARVGGWALLGLAGAAAVAGTVTGVLAVGEADDVRAGCDVGGTSTACTESSVDALPEARAVAHASTASFVVAIAAAGAGLALILTDEPRPMTLSLLPGGVSLRGRF
ncbi:MAG: hypothetical protein AAGA56_26045 [Myxococcota bacterium]